VDVGRIAMINNFAEMNMRINDQANA
jgi:hypothetical protein